MRTTTGKAGTLMGRCTSQKPQRRGTQATLTVQLRGPEARQGSALRRRSGSPSRRLTAPGSRPKAARAAPGRSRLQQGVAGACTCAYTCRAQRTASPYPFASEPAGLASYLGVLCEDWMGACPLSGESRGDTAVATKVQFA